MSDRQPVTLPRLAEMKAAGEPIVMVTAYDFPSARVAEEAGVDLVLVGDTAAMVVLGYPGTEPVSMDEMVMLGKAVRRGLKTPLMVGDMPMGSYEASNELAVQGAQRLVKETGCQVVKLEAGGTSVERARAIVRAGIPLDQFPFRQREYPHNGEWRFLQAGRLIGKKGLPTSLRAFARFAAHYPQSKFTVAGEGALLPQLQELVRQLKIDNQVSFSGFISQEQLQELLYASHIFLHPSETGRDGNQEGVPNSMLEAMASGLPVFATQHGGIPEAIENGVSGVLVAERDDAALARALLDATQDRELLARLARNGAEAVSQKFEQRAQIRKLEEIYMQLAGRGD